MFAKWLDEHKTRILDAYVALRGEEDTRPEQEARRGIESALALMAQSLRGERDWEQSSQDAVRDALAAGASVHASMADTQAMYLALCGVLEQERPAQQHAWMGVLGKYMLQSNLSITAALKTSVDEQKGGIEALYELGLYLNTAHDPEELLRILSLPAQESGASGADLLYIDLDEAGEPEWGELAAAWRLDDSSLAPPGSRYYLPEFAFSGLWLASPDEPQIIADVATDERVHENARNALLQSGMQALVIVPLTLVRLCDASAERLCRDASAERRWVGVLIFSWSAPHQCSPQEQKIYSALTGLGSSAVESRRLLGQTESALARTDTLYNISRNLNAALDEDALLRVLARPAIQAGASEADLYYIEAGDSGEPEWMEKIAAWQREGEPKTPVGTRYHMPEYPFTLRYIEKPDELQYVANIATDERLGDHLKNLMARLGTRSMATLPLAQAGRLVGLVIIQWNELHEFGTQEVETYTDLTNMAASAVVSRRLVSSLEKMVAERTADLQQMLEETARLQQEIIEAQQQAIRELSTPIIPVMNAPDGAGGILIMPLVGSIDSTRARDITRALLAGIRTHRATVVIMDITGVPLVDSGVAAYLNKTIQAAQLKGASTIITGISEAVAETIVDLGIDWSRVETLSDLRTGLLAALDSLGIGLTRKKRRGG